MKSPKFRHSGPAGLLLLLLIGMPPAGLADTVTVFSSASVYIDGIPANQDANNAGVDYIIAGALGVPQNGDPRRAVIKFDFSANVPPGATVISASVNLTTIPNFPPQPAASNFGLRRLLQDWHELEVTWNSRTTTPATNAWDSPGATGSLDSVSTASSAIFVGAVGIGQTYAFPSTTQLVSDVQGWVANPGSNYGWLLISDGEGTFKTARHFASRFYPDTNLVPSLTITFTTNSAPPVPPMIIGLTLTNGLIQFSFNAESNRTYAVEASGNAGSGYAAVSNFSAQPAGTNLVFSEPVVASSNRFYRVRTP